jgi:opacity protein-like surface antigen
VTRPTRLGGALLLMLMAATAAFAQTKVRVIKDRATIWGIEARIPLTTVRKGTVLDVIRREGKWFVVAMPFNMVDMPDEGIIAADQVEPFDAVDAPAPTPPPARPPARAQSRHPPSAAPRPVSVFAFGDVGYQYLLAKHSFSAVLGDAHGFTFGGGAEVRIQDRVFIGASVARFQENGERVFISNGEVFHLGIRDTIRIVPFAISGGYRFTTPEGAFYIGGGAGRYFYRETSDFAAAGENIDESHPAYHLLAGVEFPARGSFRAAVEFQYTSVPDALGSSGASAAFGERNLGGFDIRLKILGGR